MIHRPWPYRQRLIDRMADSSLLDKVDQKALQRFPRSKGRHCSDLLKLLHPHPNAERTAKLDAEGQAAAERQLRLYGLLGLAFEDRAELALLSLQQEADWPYAAVRPGEVMMGDIACSPDIMLVHKQTGEQRELSLKTAWKSCRGLPVDREGENEFPKSFDYYLSQCQAYALPLETQGSILLVYFMCGDWKPPVPQVHAWELDFSAQEIAETWDSMLNIAEAL